jgi:hypothetical protein
MTPPRPLVERGISVVIVAGSLLLALAAVRAASTWTARLEPWATVPPGTAILEVQLAAEQARADALEAGLEDLIAGTDELASALDASGTQLTDRTTAAAALRAELARARARLEELQRALATAGAPARTRPTPTSAGAPPPLVAAAKPTAYPEAPAPSRSQRPPSVPADWPASKPIPSMPPNCVDPQLELNGTWNCQH